MGLFYQPRRVFDDLHTHPSWLAGFLVIIIANGAYDLLVAHRFGAEVSVRAVIEKAVPAEERSSVLRARVDNVAGSELGPLLWLLLRIFIAGFFIALTATTLHFLALALGGRLSYRHALSVAVYSVLPPLLISRFLSSLLLFAKSPSEVDPFQAVMGLARLDLRFLLSLSDHSFLAIVVGSLGLLSIYRMRLMALGLRYTGHQISSLTAWLIVLIVWFLGTLISILVAGRFPAFVS